MLSNAKKTGLMFFPTDELAVLHLVDFDVLDKPLSQLDHQALS
jgi:hypothetical protein